MVFRGLRWIVALLPAAAVAVSLSGAPAHAENENPFSKLFGKSKNKTDDAANSQTSNWKNAPSGQGGKATTESRIVDDGSVAPFIVPDSAAQMQAALDRYERIAAEGGWPKVPSGKYKKGAQGKGVAALNRRLHMEGYLRDEAVTGDFLQTFTTATGAALEEFQRNHGLAVTGNVDKATLAALNVPVARRISAIRANIPRLEEYSKDLGDRYVVVNVPAMQIETVAGGRVHSIHNAIVGRPSRPTPVVMTPLETIKFNPYWNAPASIVEKDILPRMLSSKPSKVMEQMNMKVFKGVGGPEIDPDEVNWRRAVVDDYHFRQEPGGENAMKTAKIEFNSPFGIYLHDTPEPHLFDSGARFYSSGCVRVDKVEIFIEWVLRGQDGIDSYRIAGLAETKERLDVTIQNAPQLRVAYLTAWPARNGVVAFRDDVYELDGTGFVVGQPLPVGETEGGKRYVLKPVPRLASAVDADGGGFFALFKSRNPDKQADYRGNEEADDDSINSTKKKETKTKAKKKSSGFNLFASKTGKETAEKEKATKKKLTKKEEEKKKKAAASKSNSKTKTAATETAKPAKKVSKTEKSVAAAKKPETADTSKGADEKCKADASGKLPEGCEVAAKPKPEEPDRAAAN